MNIYSQKFDTNTLEDELNKLNMLDNSVAVRRALEMVSDNLGLT